MQRIAILLIILLINISNAFALEVIDFNEGETVYVNVSSRDINVIIFPVSVQVLTKSSVLEVKVEEINNKRVFVSFRQDPETGAVAKSPEHLYFLTDDKTYSLVLVPKKIPAETIMAKVDMGLNKQALKWEKENPFIDTVKELMKSMYKNIPPNGYDITYQKDNEAEKELSGITKKLNIKYLGATLTGEVYEITNISMGDIRLKEQTFLNCLEETLAASISAF